MFNCLTILVRVLTEITLERQQREFEHIKHQIIEYKWSNYSNVSITNCLNCETIHTNTQRQTIQTVVNTPDHSQHTYYTNMTRSEGTTISASTMSGAPSLVNSLQSLTSGSKLSFAQGSVKSADFPPRSFITEFLEKAKFCTSLCLGKDFTEEEYLTLLPSITIDYFSRISHIFLFPFDWI